MNELQQPLLQARGLSVKRNGRHLLKAVDLRLDAGKIVTLIGPNGAGKTTLVRSVLGLIAFDQGSIERAPGLRIGYMPQKLHLEASLPLNVERFLLLGGPARANMAEVQQLTGIARLGKTPMQLLSGGETQRVLLARALLRDPHLLVLDEPVQGVDVGGQAALYALINRIAKTRNCGVLLVSHDLHLVMATTDTVVCLNQHICCQGHPDTVTHDPAYIALFGASIPQDIAARSQIALYHHHHDHQHDDHGNVIQGSLGCATGCEHHHHA
jgi:zinc transport system ATP-binding protein